MGHWELNKRRCSSYAQHHGVSALFDYMDKVIDTDTAEEKKSLLHGMETVKIWQALRTGDGSVAACSQCLAICPVGDDYNSHLKEQDSKIEKGTDREEKLNNMRQAEKNGAEIPGYDMSKRWIGSDTFS